MLYFADLMCDILIATRPATSNQIAIFAKNSDRPPNEGQLIDYLPAARHAKNTRLRCTYIEIPQVEKTHAVLLSRPFWMWGAEMGVNEHGLAIGNEATFSKVPACKEPALLGMDLLRAALERAVTPSQAVQVITELLEQFGQGGDCTNGHGFYYHNSFVIANADEAWVLETVDRQWAAHQVRDVYSISNCLTLGSQFELASPQLVELALQKGYTRSAQQFNFARDYSDLIYSLLGRGRTRRATTLGALEQQKGGISLDSMLNALRHHDHEPFDPQDGGLTRVDVCMHAGLGPIRRDQSSASMLVALDNTTPLIFATGSSAPCTGIFKPFWLDAASTLQLGPLPTDRADASLFWTHERLHRATLLNYPERIKTYAAERDEMEKRFIQGALELHNGHAPARQRADFSNQCLAESLAAESVWLKRVETIPARRKSLHSLAWQSFNKQAGLNNVK